MLRLRPSKIVAVYAIASALWILFSDRVVGMLFSESVQTVTLVSTFKGWFYVCVMSVMLYAMIKKYKGENFQQHKTILESEERFRAIFDSVSDCIFIHDATDGRILDVNARTCAVFGYSREEFRGLDVGAVSSGVPPYTQEQAQERIRRTVQGQVLSFEWQCKARDGRLFWVEVSMSKAMLGAYERVLVSLQDISQRKRSEAALRDSEAKYRAVIENITDVYYRTDAQGLLGMVSPSGLSLLGYGSMDEILGLPNESFWMFPEQRANLMAMLRERGEARDYEVILKRKDGSQVYVSTSSRLILGEAGEMLGVEGIFRDITQRKMAEEALRALEKSNRELIEFAPIGIFQSSPAGRYLAVNRRLVEISGFDSARDLLQNVKNIGSQLYVNPEDREEILRTLERQAVTWMETRFRRKDGSVLWGALSMRAVRDAEGKLLHYEGFVSDITKSKINEERLSASLREKEVLLKEVHHRVKNNLQIISSLLNLQTEKLGNSEVALALKESQSRVRSMAAIHEELYRSENFSKIDLEHYVKFFVPRLIHLYNTGNTGISLDFDLSHTLVTIDQAIPFALILNELVTNAIRHGFVGQQDADRRIRISISVEGGRLAARIGDNGRGLPEGFDPKRSTSLGLSLVATLTDQLHGDIRAENQNGAVFTLTFPVAGQPDKQGAAKPE